MRCEYRWTIVAEEQSSFYPVAFLTHVLSQENAGMKFHSAQPTCFRFLQMAFASDSGPQRFCVENLVPVIARNLSVVMRAIRTREEILGLHEMSTGHCKRKRELKRENGEALQTHEDNSDWVFLHIEITPNVCK